MATGYPLAVRVNPKYQDFAIDMDKGPIVWRIRLSMKDFNVAATTANLDIPFPGCIRIQKCFISLITPFSGGSISAATLSIGTTGTPTAYLGATNVFTGATSSGAVTLGAGASLGNFLGGNATPAAVGTVRFQLLTTSDNASSLTAAKVDCYLDLAANSVRIS